MAGVTRPDRQRARATAAPGGQEARATERPGRQATGPRAGAAPTHVAGTGAHGSGAAPTRLAGTGAPGSGMVRISVEGDPPLVVDLPIDANRPASPVGAVRRLPPEHGQAAGTIRVEAVVDGWRFEAILEPARRAALRERVQRHDAGGGGGRQIVRAPLPGRIVRVWVTAGDTVEPGSRLCSLEAMKMENEVVAHRAGTIEQVRVEPGARVERGDELVVIG